MATINSSAVIAHHVPAKIAFCIVFSFLVDAECIAERVPTRSTLDSDLSGGRAAIASGHQLLGGVRKLSFGQHVSDFLRPVPVLFLGG